MSIFTLITGNQHKLQEWARLLPPGFDFDSRPIDLDEIQSLDSEEIIRHKVRQAYDIVGTPVVVEDVSAGLKKLRGLPGPFIKFFNERLGQDALYQLAGDDPKTSVFCTIGYYDGTNEVIVSGQIDGSVVPARGEAFGFDVVFMPHGQTKTYSEMTAAEKDAISHRSIAVQELLKRLASLNA